MLRLTLCRKGLWIVKNAQCCLSTITLSYRIVTFTLQNFLYQTYSTSSHLPEPLETTDLFTVSIVLPFQKCQIIGIIQYVALSHQFLSLSNIHFSFIHVFHGLLAYFFVLLNNIPLYGCTTISVSIHLLKSRLVAFSFW